jgi:O-antigen ligase
VTAIVVVVFAGATFWAGAGTVAARFSRAGGDVGGRVAAWQDTWRIVGDFTMFGTGFGGYRRAMTVYQTHDREALYAQAHNDYLQLLAEGGLLVTVPVVVLGVFVCGGIIRRVKAGDADPVTYWLRRGAIAGLIGIAAQSLVEFSLQIPGNTILFVVLTALALHRPRHHSSHAHRV